MTKRFPGAILKRSEGQPRGLRYVTAGGGEIKNQCEFTSVSKPSDGSMRKTPLQNAQVGLPTFSLHQVAKDNHRVILAEDAGVIVRKPSGAESPFVVRNGVYFMQLRVPKRPTEP